MTLRASDSVVSDWGARSYRRSYDTVTYKNKEALREDAYNTLYTVCSGAF